MAQHPGNNRKSNRPTTLMDLETVTRATSDNENEADDDYDERQRTQVYLHYDFSKRDAQDTLPIFDVRKEVHDAALLERWRIRFYINFRSYIFVFTIERCM